MRGRGWRRRADLLRERAAGTAPCPCWGASSHRRGGGADASPDRASACVYAPAGLFGGSRARTPRPGGARAEAGDRGLGLPLRSWGRRRRAPPPPPAARAPRHTRGHTPIPAWCRSQGASDPAASLLPGRGLAHGGERCGVCAKKTAERALSRKNRRRVCSEGEGLADLLPPSLSPLFPSRITVSANTSTPPPPPPPPHGEGATLAAHSQTRKTTKHTHTPRAPPFLSPPPPNHTRHPSPLSVPAPPAVQQRPRPQEQAEDGGRRQRRLADVPDLVDAGHLVAEGLVGAVEGALVGGGGGWRERGRERERGLSKCVSRPVCALCSRALSLFSLSAFTHRWTPPGRPPRTRPS